MTPQKFIHTYGVSIAACLALCVGLWWCVDLMLGWRIGAQSQYAEMHEFIHQSDDIPFQDGQLSDAQITARDSSTTMVKGPKDAINWSDLTKAKLDFIQKGGEKIPSPSFPKSATVLNGKTLKVKGYIFPLDQTGKQTHFLLSPYPPSCPYCLPAGPSELIEVTMKDPIKFTYDTILIKGVFETVTDERIKQGMLYAMHDAVIASE